MPDEGNVVPGREGSVRLPGSPIARMVIRRTDRLEERDRLRAGGLVAASGDEPGRR